MPAINFPNDTQRLNIVGRTGSGKTQAGVAHLSRRAFDRMPWIIFDWKGDALLNQLGATEVQLGDPPPTEPGLYIVHPLPDDLEAVDEFMKQIWLNERTGVYIDEGYMMGKRLRWFRAILTQGRSKHIPMIVLSQRPIDMDLFVFTEADFFQVFSLNYKKDKQRIEEYTEDNPLDFTQLRKYQSFYYDVSEARMEKMNPVPSREAIIGTIRLKMARIPRIS